MSPLEIFQLVGASAGMLFLIREGIRFIRSLSARYQLLHLSVDQLTGGLVITVGIDNPSKRRCYVSFVSLRLNRDPNRWPLPMTEEQVEDSLNNWANAEYVIETTKSTLQPIEPGSALYEFPLRLVSLWDEREPIAERMTFRLEQIERALSRKLITWPCPFRLLITTRDGGVQISGDTASRFPLGTEEFQWKRLLKRFLE